MVTLDLGRSAYPKEGRALAVSDRAVHDFDMPMQVLARLHACMQVAAQLLAGLHAGLHAGLQANYMQLLASVHASARMQVACNCLQACML